MICFATRSHHAGDNVDVPAFDAVCRFAAAAQTARTWASRLTACVVVPADGGLPCGGRLRGDVVRVAVETGGVVGQHQVEVGDVDARPLALPPWTAKTP